MTSLEDDVLSVAGTRNERLAYADIQAVAVAEILVPEDSGAIFIDLIFNWSRRQDERLEIVRLRADEIDLQSLVTSRPNLCSDLSSLLGDILERARAIPLPDPESALGTRIARFESQEHYERSVLRIAE